MKVVLSVIDIDINNCRNHEQLSKVGLLLYELVTLFLLFFSIFFDHSKTILAETN